MDPITALTAATGVWLWENFGKDVVASVGKSTKEKWITFHKEKYGWKKAVDRYRQALYNDYATIRVLGVSHPVSLENIYTDVYLLDEISAREYYDIAVLIEKFPSRFERRSSRQKRLDGLSLIQDERNLRLFILGKPGAGKSTFLQYLTLQATQGKINRIPMFVNLKNWSTQGGDLMTYLSEQFSICQFPDAEAFIKYLLSTGRALVLFDGLDEVNREEGLRDKITAQIEDFCREYRQAQCLITCRIAAHERAFRDFQDVEMADFNDQQIRTFVEKWFRDRTGASDTNKNNTNKNDTNKSEAFFKAFYNKDNEAVRELGNNPLLLVLLCLAFNRTMAFPQRRAELYEDAIEALLREWDSMRGIKRDTLYKGLSIRLKQDMFARIAAATFEAGHYFLTERKLIKDIEAFVKGLPGADKSQPPDGLAILKDIEAQHSLFVERAKRIYSFSHLTFQEYFTAKYIADNEARGTLPGLMPHITDHRWREVFLLTASLLHEADTFFTLFHQAIDNLIRDDEHLLRFMEWVNNKADMIADEDTEVVAIRVVYLYFALDLNLGLSFARALVLDGDLALNLAVVRDHVIGRAITNGYSFDFTSGYNFDFTRARNLVYTLNQACDFISEYNSPAPILLDLSLVNILKVGKALPEIMGDLDNVEGGIEAYRRYIVQIIALSKQSGFMTLATDLSELPLPTPKDNKSVWGDFCTELQTIMQQARDIGHTWKFSKEQVGRLVTYLDANRLLVACLDLAWVQDRAGIRGRIMKNEERRTKNEE